MNSTTVKKLRRQIKAYRLRRRRKNASKRRVGSRKTTVFLLIALLFLLGIFFGAISYLQPNAKGQQLSIGQLSSLAGANRLVSANFLDEDAVVTGTYKAAPPPAPAPSGKSTSKGSSSAKGKGSKSSDNKSSSSGKAAPAPTPTTNPNPSEAEAPAGSGSYWVAYPSDGAFTAILVQMAAKSGSDVTVDPQTVKKDVRIVSTFLLPLMILANLFALLFTAGKGGSSGIGDVLMFGSIGKGSDKRRKKGMAAAVGFGDVAGADEAVAELKEVVDYLRDPERYEEIGATPPKGVLLFGPPGCGKTLLAKAVAGEAGVPFFSVAGAEFVESLVGVGAARVRDLFARVRAVAPAIVFIDELDAAGRKRAQGGGSGGTDEREQTLNQILVEMDGFDVSAGVVVIGATNRPDILDPALLRPGRFDRHITVDQPDNTGRQLILELHAKGKPIASDVDFEYLARRTPGFSGADLANVINEAALLTVRDARGQVEMPELEEAIQRVLAGPKKKGRVLSIEEQQRAAYHESGHAIVAAAVGRAEDVHRVTILARGRGLGLASIQKESDAVLLTKDQLMGQLITAMGGLAAEQLIFGVPSTGAEQDLEHATDLARDMIGRFGMGTRRRRLLGKEGDAFLGDQLPIAEISEQTHHEMENEIDAMLIQAEAHADRLLVEHRETLDTLAARLEDEET
ncbi:MAG: cell division protease FtsH, partial [Actinomycetota bacterium]|nr:cell division protease FtsH [Actinomycetota bacterium]